MGDRFHQSNPLNQMKKAPSQLIEPPLLSFQPNVLDRRVIDEPVEVNVGDREVKPVQPVAKELDAVNDG